MIDCSNDSGQSQWNRCSSPSSGLAQRNCSSNDGDRPGQCADEIERQGHGLICEVCSCSGRQRRKSAVENEVWQERHATDGRRGTGQSIGQPVDRHANSRLSSSCTTWIANHKLRGPSARYRSQERPPSATRWRNPVIANAIGAPNTIKIRPGWARSR
jgi:hypothetical protein